MVRAAAEGSIVQLEGGASEVLRVGRGHPPPRDPQVSGAPHPGDGRGSAGQGDDDRQRLQRRLPPEPPETRHDRPHPPRRLQESGEAVRRRHQVAEVAVGVGRNPGFSTRGTAGSSGSAPTRWTATARSRTPELRVQSFLIPWLPLPRMPQLLRGEGGEALQRLDAGGQVPADAGQGEGDQDRRLHPRHPLGVPAQRPPRRRQGNAGFLRQLQRRRPSEPSRRLFRRSDWSHPTHLHGWRRGDDPLRGLLQPLPLRQQVREVSESGTPLSSRRTSRS